jgi:hypothetical protein
MGLPLAIVLIVIITMVAGAIYLTTSNNIKLVTAKTEQTSRIQNMDSFHVDLTRQLKLLMSASNRNQLVTVQVGAELPVAGWKMMSRVAATNAPLTSELEEHGPGSFQIGYQRVFETDQTNLFAAVWFNKCIHSTATGDQFKDRCNVAVFATITSPGGTYTAHGSFLLRPSRLGDQAVGSTSGGMNGFPIPVGEPLPASDVTILGEACPVDANAQAQYLSKVNAAHSTVACDSAVAAYLTDPTPRTAQASVILSTADALVALNVATDNMNQAHKLFNEAQANYVAWQNLGSPSCDAPSAQPTDPQPQPGGGEAAEPLPSPNYAETN